MRIIAAFLLASSLITTPLGAFTQIASAAATSTSTTTSSTGGSGSGLGTALGVGLGVGVAALGISSLVSSFFNLSFGGRVVAVVPCSGGMLFVTIKPAGVFPVTYIWTPATQTKLVGPPTHIGQQILGTATTWPGVCFIGGGFLSSPIPLYGNYMITVGTSAF